MLTKSTKKRNPKEYFNFSNNLFIDLCGLIQIITLHHGQKKASKKSWERLTLKF